MLRVGPNPYGLCCTLGLQGKAEHPKDLEWFIGLAEQMRGACIEFHAMHVLGIPQSQLAEIRSRLAASSIEPIISGPWPLNRLSEAFPIAKQLGAQIVRTHLSPVLCGARAAQGAQWARMVADIRDGLAELGPRFTNEGLTLGIENHQDFGSEELLEFCEIGGDSVGITLDTGNPLAVAEEPVAFARKVAHKVRHLHLKDYRAQLTPEGFRLVRCPIGDGAIPFEKIADVLAQHSPTLTASLEPGALDSRHVKLLTSDWWLGYPPRASLETEACLAAARVNSIPAEEDSRTPWERMEDPEAVCRFEMEQMMKSVKNMQSLGWLPA